MIFVGRGFTPSLYINLRKYKVILLHSIFFFVIFLLACFYEIKENYTISSSFTTSIQ